MRKTDIEPATIPVELVEKLIQQYYQPTYKKRFLAKFGNRIIFKPVEEIAYFYAEDKVVYLKELGSARKYIVNHSLEELESELLDPMKFYRINRSVIINLDGLMEMKTYHNGRLKLMLNAQENDDLVVARERVAEFKNWINQ